MVQTRSPEGSAAAARPQGRRLEILRRAAEVFRAKGYHRAGMREIAEGLGLAPGALYYYFASKEDLLQACQEESLARLTRDARAIAALDAPADERLRRLVAMHLELTLGVMGATAAHIEFKALPRERLERVVELRDAYERIVRAIIEDGVAAGTFAPLDAKMTSLALLGALNWTVTWWRPDGRWDRDELARGTVDLFLDGLRARGKETR